MLPCAEALVERSNGGVPSGVRVRYGNMRITTLLRRETWMVNHKRVHRIYKQAGSNLRNKRPRRSSAAAHREAGQRPSRRIRHIEDVANVYPECLEHGGFDAR